MTVEAQDVRYDCEGTAMHGRLYRDDAHKGPRPGVLVFPEAFGISDHTYGNARRLAELGYAALACDLLGDGFFHNGASEEMKSRFAPLVSNPGRLVAVGQSALHTLIAHEAVDESRIAAIGYCIGGAIAVEMAFAGAPLAAAVAFHPGFMGITSVDPGKIRGRLLLCIGADDPVAAPEERAAFEARLKGSGVRWQINLYGSVRHSFTNANSGGPPEMVAFDEWANRDSWNAMIALFDEVFA